MKHLLHENAYWAKIALMEQMDCLKKILLGKLLLNKQSSEFEKKNAHELFFNTQFFPLPHSIHKITFRSHWKCNFQFTKHNFSANLTCLKVLCTFFSLTGRKDIFRICNSLALTLAWQQQYHEWHFKVMTTTDNN